MVNPLRDSCKNIKKLARYVMGRGAIKWRFDWQNEVSNSKLFADIDWEWNIKDRRCISGGISKGSLGPAG